MYLLLKNQVHHILVTLQFRKVLPRQLLMEYMFFLKSKEIIMNDIVANGSDGTAVNTDSTGGVNRLLELKLNGPLHRFICQLHANELSLHNLFSEN